MHYHDEIMRLTLQARFQLLLHITMLPSEHNTLMNTTYKEASVPTSPPLALLEAKTDVI